MYNYYKLQFTLQQIAKITNGKLIGQNLYVNSIVYDSRLPFESEKSLFVALKTKRSDGHRFVNQVIEKGGRAFLISEKDILNQNESFVLVEDTLKALQSLAAYQRSNFSGTLVGITGSTGKTTVKEWLNTILIGSKKVIKSPKSFNSQLGVALSALKLENNFNLAILEAGISTPNEMEKLEQMIKPHIGLITNIGEAHQANFTSYGQKLKEKLILFKNAEFIIYNIDNELIHKNIIEKFKKKKLFTWGHTSNADLRIVKTTNTELECVFQEENIKINLASSNRYFMENLMHCIATCLLLQIPINEILNGVKEIKPLPMRLEMKHGQNGILLVNDSYSADFSSLEVALDYLHKVAGAQKKTLILSEFDDQNIEANQYKVKLERLSNRYGLRKLILIGNQFNSIELGNVELHQYENTEAFINHNSVNFFANEAILIKGARRFKLERLLNLFQAKSHRTRLEINLSALTHNFRYFENQLGNQTQLMVMLKALGYGAGTFELARLLQNLNAAYIAVAYIDEGVELRQKGITMPIMVLSPDIEGFSNLIQYNLEPEVYSFEILDELLIFLIENDSFQKLPIHVNIDTGMKRLGFEVNEIEKLGLLLQENQQWFDVKSVFTHLAASDEPLHDEFTQNQISLLQKAIASLRRFLDSKFFVHAANTGGILRHKNARFDMVRLGIGFYGVDPTQNKSYLQLAFRWVTQISQIKKVAKGESVGYSRRFVASKETKIATIPIGYADGFTRLQGNEVGSVYINGIKAPILGSVCMDMCMVNIDNIECNVGDEVVIFENNQQLDQLCKNQNTIPYELLSQISARVKRIYLEE